MTSIVAFIVIVGFVIVIHELGHYLAARWQGIRVEVFSLGLGGHIASWRDRHGTRWQLGYIPLGGYIRLSETIDQDSSVVSRIIMIAAGPLANVILTVVLLAAIAKFTGQPSMLPIIGQVLPDSAADHAGLRPQDRIVAIDTVFINSFGQLAPLISQEPGKTVVITIQRNDAERRLTAIIASRTVASHIVGTLGIAPTMEPISIPAAVVDGTVITWRTAGAIIGALMHLSPHDFEGPVAIAQLAGQATQDGLINTLSFMAILSINLGLLNLIPLPMLDGGRLLYCGIELVCGRPLPKIVQNAGLAVSALVLAGLFVFTTWHDLTRLWLGG